MTTDTTSDAQRVMTDGGETMEVEAPCYHVETGAHMPNFIFPSEDYAGAFEQATGAGMADHPDGHSDERRISIMDFDGTMEVPVADV